MSPTFIVKITDLALSQGGRSLSLTLGSGDGFAVMGPSGSGKFRFMDVLLGRSKPTSGSFHSVSAPVTPNEREPGRRVTPQAAARSVAKGASSSRLTQVLSGLGLWDARHVPIVQLDTEQQAACELLPVFLKDSEWAVIDGGLDRLDPWSRNSALGLVQEEREQGRVFVIGTNLSTVAESVGSVLFFSGGEPVFAGSVWEAMRVVLPTEIIVETDDTSTVASMVEPFTFFVQPTEGGLLIRAEKGQELAARLLTQGYGTVKSILLKQPTLLEALEHLV
ncbi:MAG: ATP-binding cassette domain-containing protein [Armatimonadetes bacterium]|nr:ATP-binding cassette domain-containing protein [Armatimonadota bacterium]